jgi:urease accessory protein
MNNKLPGHLLALTILALPAVAWAHIGSAGTAGGFLFGAGHPFSGGDHLLAMLAVGLLAAQSGGRSLWSVPAAFVLLMLAGAVCAMAGVSLVYVEEGIVVSLLVLGLLVAGAFKLNFMLSLVLVGAFAVFHGHAHGAGMPAASAAVSYGLGFVLSTALLHGLGIAAATCARQGLTRLAGIAIALSGVYWAVA